MGRFDVNGYSDDIYFCIVESGMHILIVRTARDGDSMDLKTKLIRCLSQATCDQVELNKKVLWCKKCFDEANAALCGKKKPKK